MDSLQSEPPGKPKNAGVGSLSPEPGIESGSPALQMDSLPAKPREAQLHTAIYKIDKQQGLTEYPREQYQYLEIRYNEKESEKECICVVCIYIYIKECACVCVY